MTPEQVNELRERSKNDRAFIAGSEVRALCGEVDKLTAALAVAKSQSECQLLKMRAESNAEIVRWVASGDDDAVLAVHLYATGETAKRLEAFLRRERKE
ncbi:MAG: hypothetical protein ACRD68_00035 [Pyrinomonadaceae bacterium]